MNYNPRPQASTNSSNPEDDLVAVFRALTRNNWSTDEAANFVATLVGNNTTRASNPPQYTSTPNPTLWQNPMSSAIAPPWQNYRTTASTIAPQPSYMTSNTHQPQPHYGHHQSTISELDIQATRLLTQISNPKKIKYLRSKLVGPAGDFLEQYQLDHPVEATCYETLKRPLKERFIGKNMEHKYRTSFNSCKREPGESIRNFAHRIQKLARGGYPNVSHEEIEQLSRDKFMNGLAPQLHDRLFCKDFPSFDQMIETAERHDSALELINSRENPGTGDATGPLARKEDEAKDISDLMREVIRSELAKNAETRKPERREPRNGQYDTSDKFCTYHNMYGHDTNNCAARQYQMRLVCEICGRRGHNRNSCRAPGNHPSAGQQPPNNPPPRDYYNQPPRPQQQQTPQYPPPTANNSPTNNTSTGQLNEHVGPNGGNDPKPRQYVRSVQNEVGPPRITLKAGEVTFEALFDSGAGRSLLNNNLYSALGALKTLGTVTLQFQLVDEESPDLLVQSFIVVDDITENCVLGLDALYGHKFIFNGSEKTIYRMRKSDQPTHEPVMITPRKITIPPYTAQVVESERGGGKLPPNIACSFIPAPEFPKGVRLDPFVSKKQGNGLFRIVIINEIDKQITIPAFRVLGTVVFTEEKTQHTVASCSYQNTPTDPNVFNEALAEIPSKENKPY
ncbi:hypothetical protein OUZ56_018712 [Daphnia magna]|uniref:CCHC-type domain-containing protein n=1 Tax=Daphnia magna TaxID=35525 RepID=A0ABQ9Z9L0_9CRUS|nr:hypothetical protein OUZ56_018712 [Daphnia magna]